MRVKKRIAVMISGNGTGLQAIIDACADGRVNGEIVGVISSNIRAFGIKRAENSGIFVQAITKSAGVGARHSALVALNPDIIVLAGFLGILPPETVTLFNGKIINIHPALLPAFGGKGFFGHHVQEAVLKRGCKVTGATVHLVNYDIDGGPILLQEAIPVLPDDTPDTLAARLAPVEHRLLIEAIRSFCE